MRPRSPVSAADAALGRRVRLGALAVVLPPLGGAGEPAAITVVNRLDEPTTVHWHGMELESVFDGVAGWSGREARRTPLVAPGDSFTVTFTPPRAGTFIYPSHVEEEAQLSAGLYGPLLVLEPGEWWGPATDHVLMIGGAVVDGVRRPALNGTPTPPPLTLRAGVTYRLRLVNILPVVPVQVELRAGAAPATWRALAKDGAVLPAARRVEGPARLKLGVGETYDFAWTPAAGDGVLGIQLPEGVRRLRQEIRVRP